MSKIIQTLITLLITASFILQILVLLGNFNGLRSVNIVSVQLENAASTGSGGLLSDIFAAAQDVAVGIPNYLTMALFVICEGRNDNSSMVCSPPSFGYRYNSSSSTLQMIENQIPEWVHRTMTGVQGGVFITSVIFCFILLCYNFYYQCTSHSMKHQFGGFRKSMIVLIALIGLLLCIATFVIQIVAYNILKREINNVKGALFGGLIESLVTLNTRTGTSIWISLAAAIALFFVTILLLFSVCCMDRRRNRQTTEESYSMDRI